MFMDISPLKEPVIFAAAGGRILVREMGTICMDLMDPTGAYHPYMLTNVYVIPGQQTVISLASIAHEETGGLDVYRRRLHTADGMLRVVVKSDTTRLIAKDMTGRRYSERWPTSMALSAEIPEIAKDSDGVYIPADEAGEVVHANGGEAGIGADASGAMRPLYPSDAASTLPIDIHVTTTLTDAQANAMLMHARMGHLSWTRMRGHGIAVPHDRPDIASARRAVSSVAASKRRRFITIEPYNCS